MADVKRFNSKNGIENGAQESNLSMSDILISQHITGDNNDYKLTLAQAQAIPYGVCESLGDEDKTVNLVNYPSTYTAQIGNKVLIKFIHANTKGHVSDNTYPTLTVGGVTKPIAAQGKTIGAGAIVDDQIIELVLTPDYWNIDQNIREVTSAYTILTDGTTIYTKAQTDNTINGALANLQNPISRNYLNDNINDIFPLDDKEITFINIASETNNLPTKNNEYYLVKISKIYVIPTLSAFYEECEKLVGQREDTGYKYQRWGWVDTTGVVWKEWKQIATI